MEADKSSTVIMVIEDDRLIRSSLQELLEGEGYQVKAAVHGEEALEILDGLAKPPSLILLDLMMPVMDGQEFLKVLEERVAGGYPALPVIITSAGVDAGRTSKTLVKEFLKKPIDLDAFLAAIQKYT